MFYLNCGIKHTNQQNIESQPNINPVINTGLFSTQSLNTPYINKLVFSSWHLHIL